MQPGLFTNLFGALDGILFFVKDRAGKFISIIRGTGVYDSSASRSGSRTTAGFTDYDLYPKSIADRIRADDRRVMETREPLMQVVELLVNPSRCAIGWHVTNKFPVLDSRGKVIGVMGTVQPCQDRFKKLLEGTRLDDVVSKIHEHSALKHSIEELADSVGMSPRQMGRHFHKILGMSPRDFMILCRMKTACERLIQTHNSVTEIALECGFFDQSAFAYQFRRSIGMSPLEYRKRYLTSIVAHSRVS